MEEGITCRYPFLFFLLANKRKETVTVLRKHWDDVVCRTEKDKRCFWGKREDVSVIGHRQVWASWPSCTRSGACHEASSFHEVAAEINLGSLIRCLKLMGTSVCFLGLSGIQWAYRMPLDLLHYGPKRSTYPIGNGQTRLVCFRMNSAGVACRLFKVFGLQFKAKKN